MTATDELRRLLDERGAEWDELVGHPVVVGTEWHDRYGCPCTALEHADDVPDGMLSVQANLTPEQAIAATLGSDLKAENEKLREERDMYRDLVGMMDHPDLNVQLQAENAKLRELVRDYIDAPCTTCDCWQDEFRCWNYDGADCGLVARARELGVEV